MTGEEEEKNHLSFGMGVAMYREAKADSTHASSAVHPCKVGNMGTTVLRSRSANEFLKVLRCSTCDLQVFIIGIIVARITSPEPLP
jgi:hypothetical protein